jgi:V-type H+-transporting ATPase subunit G
MLPGKSKLQDNVIITHNSIFLDFFTDRVERLKAARTQAEAEIEALKQSKKEQFALFEKSIVSGLEEAIIEHNKKEEQELKATLEMAQKNKDDVVKLLIEKVLNVQPQLHPNFLFHLNKEDQQ